MKGQAKRQASATKAPNGGHERPQVSSVWWQRPRETEFVTVRIRQVEVALAPFGIAGSHGWREPCGKRTLIEFVDIGHIEDHASPPGPVSVRRLGDQFQVARPSSKAGERGCFTAIQDLKPKCLSQPAIPYLPDLGIQAELADAPAQQALS